MKDQPKQIFNWYLWTAALFIALPGVAKGFDEGWVKLLLCLVLGTDNFLILSAHSNIARVIVNKHFQEVFGLNKVYLLARLPSRAGERC